MSTAVFQNRLARGFTLIEVLIGVLILALGVLGLGAIIPVIVREQRNAADATLGIATANAARGDLLRKPGFDPSSSEPTIWDAFLDNGASSNPWSEDGQWTNWNNPSLDSVVITGRDQNGLLTREVTRWDFAFNDLGEGEMTWEADVQIQRYEFDPANNSWGWVNRGNANRIYTLPIAARIWPSAAAQPVQNTAPGTDPYRPQFVWDFVARRVPSGSVGNPDKVQVALFVRRIDLSIRVPRGKRLIDVLTDWQGNSTSDAERCFPVASDRVTNTSGSGARTSSCGLPTNRGNASPGTRYYSEPVFLAATFDPAYRDEIRLTGLSAQPNTDPRWVLASQAGQKLVDNLGNVYTVRGPAEETADPIVVIDPPIPAWVPNPGSPNPPNLPSTGFNPAKLNQVVFTPQIPAAVSIFTITRPLN